MHRQKKNNLNTENVIDLCYLFMLFIYLFILFIYFSFFFMLYWNILMVFKKSIKWSEFIYIECWNVWKYPNTQWSSGDVGLLTVKNKYKYKKECGKLIKCFKGVNWEHILLFKNCFKWCLTLQPHVTSNEIGRKNIFTVRFMCSLMHMKNRKKITLMKTNKFPKYQVITTTVKKPNFCIFNSIDSHIIQRLLSIQLFLSVMVLIWLNFVIIS